MSDTEHITDNLEEISPWTDIWFSPRPTIKWLIDNQYSSILLTLVLIYLGGVHYGIGHAEQSDYGDKKEIADIITTVLLTSGFGGLITYNILIWAIDFCASWFGGKGNFRATQVAFAWSMLPSSFGGLILTLIGYILFEDELFKSEEFQINIYSNTFLYGAYWTYAIIEVTLGLWNFALLTATVSKVQQLTIGKSILSIIVGAVLCLLPAIGLIYLMRLG